MFVTFFLPTFVQHSQLSHQLYRQMEAMGRENLYIIAPEYYFHEHTWFPETHHIRQPWLQKQFYHPYPSQSEIDAFPRSIYPQKFLQELRRHWHSDIVLHNMLQSQVFPEYEDWIEKALKDAAQCGTVEGILAWRDCASLNAVAARKNIPVIYNELGPFRPPLSHETCYFDCTGVKKSNEARTRFEHIRHDATLRKSYEMWAERLFPHLFDALPGRGCAALLACEEDFAFMRGFSNYRLLAYAREKHPGREVLARPHPLGKNARYLDFVYDDSPDLTRILERCDHAVTAYSNGGIELLARGLDVEFVGDTPLRFLSCENLPAGERAWKAGFFALNYLIPGESLFSGEYCRWRLSAPSEHEIFERHAEYWQRQLAQPGKQRVFSCREGNCE
jgi:hypothetical protein